MIVDSVFKRITHGAEFDFKKFKSDAVLFKFKNESQTCNQVDTNPEEEKNKLHVLGEDIPEAVFSFEEMRKMYNISDAVMKNIEKAQFIKPTLVQTQAIPLMMQKRELICCSYTGSGKTFAFLLPIICNLQKSQNDVSCNSNVKAIILEPTCELARQVYRECIWFSHSTELKICLINNVYKFKQSNFDILITTPKRLVYLLNKKSLFIENAEYLVIDECDRLFGHEFRSQLAVIYNACSQSPNISRALFSATFNKKLEKWFQINLDNVVTLLIGEKFNIPQSIKQELLYVGDKNGKYMAIKEIILEGIQPPVLIFCQYKNSANVLYAKMKNDKYNVSVIHSEISEEKRSQIVNKFRLGQIWFLICTEMMGRGIDFKGISCLINYDYPPDLVTYIHRVGRTGRAGRAGRAITFFTHQEMEHPTKLKYIIKIMKQSGCEIPEYLNDFKKYVNLPPVKRKKNFFNKSSFSIINKNQKNN